MCLHGSTLWLLLIFKDDARCQLGALQREVRELKGERDLAQSRVSQLQNTVQEYQEGKTLFFYLILNQKTKTSTSISCQIVFSLLEILNVCLTCVIVAKRALDEHLMATQILLQQQEEMVRRGDRERRALTDRVKDLDRSLQASETDKKHTQVHTHTNIHTFEYFVYIHTVFVLSLAQR